MSHDKTKWLWHKINKVIFSDTGFIFIQFIFKSTLVSLKVIDYKDLKTFNLKGDVQQWCSIIHEDCRVYRWDTCHCYFEIYSLKIQTSLSTYFEPFPLQISLFINSLDLHICECLHRLHVTSIEMRDATVAQRLLVQTTYFHSKPCLVPFGKHSRAPVMRVFFYLDNLLIMLWLMLLIEHAPHSLHLARLGFSIDWAKSSLPAQPAGIVSETVASTLPFFALGYQSLEAWW